MKKWAALAVFATLLLAATPVFAKGPAEKATGTVGIPQRGWYAEFNAHEATDGRPEKGSMRMWSDEVDRELNLEVSNVHVYGNVAEFVATCTYDSWISHSHYRVGKKLYVKVEDNGEPGINVDRLGWYWEDNPMYNWWLIIDGNLQVHSDWVLVETVQVNAVNPSPTESITTLEDGVQYELVAMGTAYAGGISTYDIEFDAKYSITHSNSGDTWTDTVTDYVSYGTTLLDLFVNGVSVDWGAYNTLHIYNWTLTGTGAPVELWIYDIYYPNNTGFITVNIYRLP